MNIWTDKCLVDNDSELWFSTRDKLLNIFSDFLWSFKEIALNALG